MTDYISREMTIDAICRLCNANFEEDPCEPSECEMMLLLRKIPAADVRPVVRGKWIDDKGNPVPWDELDKTCPRGSAYCSVCGEWLTASDEYPAIGNFCPNCGCAMEGTE